MKYLNEAKKRFCKEFDDLFEKGVISTANISMYKDLSKIIKNLGDIEMQEGEDSSYRMGSYNDGMSMARNRSYNGSYDDGNSYARKGQHYVQGHYSYDNGMGMNNASNGNGRYSYADAKDHMLNQIGQMMTDASPKVRETLEHAMHQIQGER